MSSFPFKLVTEIVLIAALIIVVGWDIVADIVSVQGVAPGSTVSEIVNKLARTTPMIPLAIGVVMGHLFMAFEAWDPFFEFIRPRPLIALLWGVMSGAMFWYQGWK